MCGLCQGLWGCWHALNTAPGFQVLGLVPSHREHYWHSEKWLKKLQGCPPRIWSLPWCPDRGCTWWALQLGSQDKQASLLQNQAFYL